MTSLFLPPQALHVLYVRTDCMLMRESLSFYFSLLSLP